MDIEVNERFKASIQAILFALIAWTAFVGADTVSKLLTLNYSVPQILCLSAIVNLAITAIWILWKYGKQSFVTPYFKWHMARGISVTGTGFFIVSALSTIPLADFYGIIFLSPLVLCILAYFIFGEQLGIHRIGAVIVGFGGVLVLAGPQFTQFNIGILFAFIGMGFVSLNAVIVRKMRDETVTPLFAFYPSIYTIILNGPLMIIQGFKFPELHDIPHYVLATALVLTGLTFFSMAFKRTPEISVIAPFQYTQIIFGILFGYFLFGDVPTTNTIIGAIIIVAAGLYVIWREHKKKNIDSKAISSH